VRVCVPVSGVFSLSVSCVRVTCWLFYVFLGCSHMNTKNVFRLVHPVN